MMSCRGDMGEGEGRGPSSSSSSASYCVLLCFSTGRYEEERRGGEQRNDVKEISRAGVEAWANDWPVGNLVVDDAAAAAHTQTDRYELSVLFHSPLPRGRASCFVLGRFAFIFKISTEKFFSYATPFTFLTPSFFFPPPLVGTWAMVSLARGSVTLLGPEEGPSR